MKRTSFQGCTIKTVLAMHEDKVREDFYQYITTAFTAEIHNFCHKNCIGHEWLDSVMFLPFVELVANIDIMCDDMCQYMDEDELGDLYWAVNWFGNQLQETRCQLVEAMNARADVQMLLDYYNEH